jgi:hypothetical protein
MGARCSLVAAVWCALAGCAARSSARGPESSGGARHEAPELTARGDAAAPADGPAAALTARECEAVVDHMVDLELAARRAQGEQPVPDVAARAALAELRAELVPACEAGLDRASYDGVMATAAAGELRRCLAAADSGSAGESGPRPDVVPSPR